MDEASAAAYSEARFREKLRRQAIIAGREVVEKALQLFYALKSPATPAWARTTIIGGLAYFILPLDTIPDFIPVAGFTDDLGALAAAIATVSMYITDDIRAKAAEQTRRWFGGRSSRGGEQAAEAC